MTGWESSSWDAWQPADEVQPVARLGSMLLYAGTDHREVVTDTLPVITQVPHGLNMLWRQQGADQAFVPEPFLLQLLTAFPAGKLHFTLVDPVGLGRNVASLMHLADHDPGLIADRAWVEPRHIEQQLADLSEQMQTIIQKYLKREFETMEEYNAQAGNIEEPYRLLVVNNFPVNFSADALRHLINIATIGPRCGVYTLIAVDGAQKLPYGFVLDDLLRAASIVIDAVPGSQGSHAESAVFAVREPKLQTFPMHTDHAPSAEQSRAVLDRVGSAALVNSVVEVPFMDLAPDVGAWWQGSSIDRLSAPIGIFGARKRQHLVFGKNERGEDLLNGALVVGKVGSGKSTLHHVAIMSLAVHYAPDELELYLLDFKQGVEFKTYAVHNFPHARVIAVESEREFALSVLQRLDQELERRGKLFREVTERIGETASISSYRRHSGEPLPRILLLIDEYQELFRQDDALAQTANVVLERLVRLGRAYGIHIILSTQSLAGGANLNRQSTQGLMAVRIAMMSSESDARLILADDNPEARLLNRPGEAIYNDQAGRLEGNNRFQTAWLSSDDRDQLIEQLGQLARSRFPDLPPPIVFEGDRAADVYKNAMLRDLLDGHQGDTIEPTIWLGDPIAIARPTGPRLEQQAGNNLLIIGQDMDTAYGMLATSIVGLARHHELKRDEARIDIIDLSPAETVHSDLIKRVAGLFPDRVRLLNRRRIVDQIEALQREIAHRLEQDDVASFPPIYWCIGGLQRARDLREDEGSLGASLLDLDPVPSPNKQFLKILRDGPEVGVHVLAWVDSAGNLFRTLERRVLSEFDWRVAMQMSADDSREIIDTHDAVSLGQNRAILHSEERGVWEKFRPYALPSDEWLRLVEARA